MTATEETRSSLIKDLRKVAGATGVLDVVPAGYLHDASERTGRQGWADAVCLPHTADEVRRVVSFCYRHGIPVTPRGGGSGLAGGAVPRGGVVVGLERLAQVRTFDPPLWRIEVDAGVTTARLRDTARSSGLLFPPDPGAAESSQVGGNIATNAGGPHAFKYGVTSRWVTGLEVVIAPGEQVRIGGPLRKDVAGYDLRSLLIGSEGTLGIITGAWISLIPSPEIALPIVAFYESTAAGTDALARVLGYGVEVAALEFLDGDAVRIGSAAFPFCVPNRTRFIVIADAEGSSTEATRLRAEAIEALKEESLGITTPESRADIRSLWRWRDGLSLAIAAARGTKVSHDITVPLERLADAIDGTKTIGAAHGLPTCSYGHAGDGNMHATFMVAAGDIDELKRAHAASRELFALALALSGSVSGEHGIGETKSGQLERQLEPPVLCLMEGVKRLLDPKGLFNPGKKFALRNTS